MDKDFGYYYEDNRRQKETRFWPGFAAGMLAGMSLFFLISMITFQIARSGREAEERYIPSEQTPVSPEEQGKSIDIEALTGEKADQKVETIAKIIEEHYYPGSLDDAQW